MGPRVGVRPPGGGGCWSRLAAGGGGGLKLGVRVCKP